MSLQHAAKHLEKHGRNGDTVLVHMSKGEVKSLNDIAMAGGGHLTINPHTGLPEAGFLRSLLPMIAGAGLMAVSGGAINPMTAGLLVGGGTAVATGDINKGLMAGLGAYGGAGMAGGLAASGTQAAAVPPSAAAPVPATAAVPPPPPPVVAQPAFPTAPSPTPLADAAIPTPKTLEPLEMTSMPKPTSMKLDYKPVTPDLPASVISPKGAEAYQSSLADQQAAFRNGSFGENLNTMGKGAQTLTQPGGLSKFYENLGNVEYTYGPKTTLAAAAAPIYSDYMESKKPTPEPVDSDPGQQYTYEANAINPTPAPDPYGREQKYYNQRYVPRAAGGGTVEAMSNANAIGANTGYPMADIKKGAYATPYQQPISRNVLTDAADAGVNPMTGQMSNFARGGLSDAGYNLGGYSDGGRLLRGPGDGVSDSIPAVIGKRQPARLADGEFVVPARIVSELGNGSTEAGARKLYAMMDRIQKARGKTVGKGKVAKNSRSEKHLPA
jgi:hypothetical protein